VMRSGADLTEIDAVAAAGPADAVSVVSPAVVPAVNVTEGPLVDESVPGAPAGSVHAGATETAFPYASAPVAVKVCSPPERTVDVAGETLTLSSAAGPTVAASVTPWRPAAVAASVAVPACLSR